MIDLMNIKSFWLKMSVAVMMTVGLYACSSDDSDLFDYVSTENMMIVSANIHDVCDNAGFEVTPDGVIPTETFRRILAKSGKSDVIELLNMPGVNLDRVIVMANADGGNDRKCNVVFAIDDVDKFTSWLKDNGLDASTGGGMEAYSQKDGYSIVIDGNCGLIVYGNPERATKEVEALKRSAEENPLDSWQKETLSNGRTFAMLMDVAALYNMNARDVRRALKLSSSDDEPGDKGYLVFTSSLSGLEWDGECFMCDAGGDKVEIDLQTYPLATSLLEYADGNDCMVALVSMPMGLDFPGILKFSGVSGVISWVADVLATIHSVMLAGSPSDIAKYNDPAAWSGVLVAEMEPGSAQKYMRLVKMMAGQIDATVSPDGSEVSAAMMGMNATLKADGDNLVLTVNAREGAVGECPVKASDFGDGYGGMIIDIPSGSPVVKSMSLPFGINFKATLDNDGAAGSLKLSGTEGGLLENVIEFIASKQ